MRTLLMASFTIELEESEPVPQAYERIQTKLWESARKAVSKKESGILLTRQATVSWQSDDERYKLQWDEWKQSSEADQRLTRLVVGYPFQETGWEVECKLCTTSDAQSEIFVSANWRSQQGGTSEYPLKQLPQLLSTFSNERCHTLGTHIPFAVHALETGDVESFVSEVVENPERPVPIVLISPRRSTGIDLVQADCLCHKLFGLGLVYRFADLEAAERYYDCCKRANELACYDGAVRLLWPRNGEAQPNPYWLTWKIERMGTTEFDKLLFQRIARASVTYATVPAVLPILEAARERQIHDEWQMYEREAYASLEELEQLKQQLEQLNEENARLQERIDFAAEEAADGRDKQTQEIDILTRRNRHLEQQIHALKQENDELRARVRELDQASVPCTIWLSDKATKTYEDATPSQRDEFDKILRRLQQYTMDMHQNRKKQRNTHTEAMGADKGDCYTFPKKATKARLFYFDHPDGSVRVCELASHSDDSYDHLYDRGVFRADYPQDGFAPWSLPSTR